MTYEELLAICDNYSFKDSSEPVKALRAVFELHKPKLDYVGRPQCSECLIGNSWKHWPCATIQAIEKELK